jgi:hypothetical protein
MRSVLCDAAGHHRSQLTQTWPASLFMHGGHVARHGVAARPRESRSSAMPCSQAADFSPYLTVSVCDRGQPGSGRVVVQADGHQC